MHSVTCHLQQAFVDQQWKNHFTATCTCLKTPAYSHVMLAKVYCVEQLTLFLSYTPLFTLLHLQVKINWYCSSPTLAMLKLPSSVGVCVFMHACMCVEPWGSFVLRGGTVWSCMTDRTLSGMIRALRHHLGRREGNKGKNSQLLIQYFNFISTYCNSFVPKLWSLCELAPYRSSHR